ncbi:MAG: helix-turn-helix transcriptional regulator [Burkholderiaceae bacterium]
MEPLTHREQSCLQWAALGKTSREMGIILGLTERTVNFHIHNACRKLGVHGRQAAITAALQGGLLSGLSGSPARYAKTHPLAVQENRSAPQ